MDTGPDLPHATADLPGCGGRLKTVPEDFRVEEIPLYPPSGAGEHLYIEVEKRGMSTQEAIGRIAGAFGISPGRIGHAGRKDSRAITRQWLSIHSKDELPLDRCEGGGLRILRASRHANKLRTGHLRGNRFAIVVRGVSISPEFTEIIDRVHRLGFPNYFGEQRFGATGENAQQGKALVMNGFSSRMPIPRIRFLTNAYQAALFNRLVARRLRETGDCSRLLAGDIAVWAVGRAHFKVEAAELESSNRRALEGEISPSAPLFGYKTPLAGGVPGRWEAELLDREKLQPEDFKAGGKRLSAKGERRAVRAFPSEFDHEFFTEDDTLCLRLGFTLGAGIYATTLLREIMKPESTAPQRPENPPDLPISAHIPLDPARDEQDRSKPERG